jgi:hypothetical protein
MLHGSFLSMHPGMFLTVGGVVLRPLRGGSQGGDICRASRTRSARLLARRSLLRAPWSASDLLRERMGGNA